MRMMNLNVSIMVNLVFVLGGIFTSVYAGLRTALQVFKCLYLCLFVLYHHYSFSLAIQSLFQVLFAAVRYLYYKILEKLLLLAICGSLF